VVSRWQRKDRKINLLNEDPSPSSGTQAQILWGVAGRLATVLATCHCCSSVFNDKFETVKLAHCVFRPEAPRNEKIQKALNLLQKQPPGHVF
jgi:hypothetical protein